MTGKKIIGGLLALTLAGTLAGGCAPAQQSGNVSLSPISTASAETRQERVSGVGFYFDTVVTLTLLDAPESLLEELWTACKHYEGLLSKTIDTSDVARINRANGQPVTVDPETWEILRRAKEISDATGHAFSITVAPLTAMWDFTGGTERMPDDETRLAALPLVDDDALVLGDGYTVTLPAGMEIDLGGIAKGYIADQAAAMVKDRAGGATLNFGGNVYAVGKKPDGSIFRVGVTDPEEPSAALVALSVTDQSVVTSGIYERFFMVGDKRYHHILDPKDGLPAETDLASATIVSESSMTADAVATACIVLGSAEAEKLLERMGLDALMISRSGEIMTTPGFADKYRMTKLK